MDWTIKITDIVTIIAIFAGPIVAVQLTEFLRKKEDTLRRRVHIFRTLMCTRLSTLAVSHIEALNLVELEFHTAEARDKKVVDQWKMYLSHLNDRNYLPADGWEQRRRDLLIDLLDAMGSAIGYSFDKSSIKTGAYSPQGHLDFESDNAESRKLWLEILRGKRPLVVAPIQLPQPTPPQQGPQGPA